MIILNLDINGENEYIYKSNSIVKNMKKIAIIGAGVFGVSAALELSKNFEVTIFERAKDILMGASTNNHLRHHYGYHYPRSAKTALESIMARESFESEYGKCVVDGFPAYYGVSKTDSKTTAEDFIKFCDSLKMPYKFEFPSQEIMDSSIMNLCIKVPEPVYDPDKLREVVWEKLKNSNIEIRLKNEIIGGGIVGKQKKLKLKSPEGIKEEKFDYVISAIYTNFNNINKWFNFPKKKALYALMELLELELPLKEKIGVTLMDGKFSTFLPKGAKNTFLLGHVKESVLKEVVSDDFDSKIMESENKISNKDKILNESIKYYPILNKAKFIKSIFVTRVVNANVENTDERPTEITEHGNGIYSIFGGKVITCVDTAKKLAEMIK